MHATDGKIGPWVPDNGDGTYRNPILFADYSDPDIIRVKKDFYLTASSFNCMPGLPLLHSRDLVNWKLIGHVCRELPLPGYGRTRHGDGLWAPTFAAHGGWLYVFVCTPDEGLFMARTKNPAGEWEPLTHVKTVTGWIDPCAFWDDDGTAYLLHAFANSRVGIKSLLHLCRLSPDGRQILDQGRFVVDANGRHDTMEGPRLFKREGFYYITAPAGGIRHGYQVVMRARHIYGPYEDRIVIHEGGGSGLNGPRQGNFLALPSGETWFYHFQDKGAYGRVVCLEPAAWRDGWPIAGRDIDGDGIGEPVAGAKKPDVGAVYPVETPQTSDDFADGRPGPQWQWHANPRAEWAAAGPHPGCLRLFAGEPVPQGVLFYAPNLLLQKFPAPVFSAQTTLTFSPDCPGDRAGLLVMGLRYRSLAVLPAETGGRLVLIDGDSQGGELATEMTLFPAGAAVDLKVEVAAGALCRFFYRVGGGAYQPAGAPFPAETGRWIGAKVGIYCVNAGLRPSRGFADFGAFAVGGEPDGTPPAG